MPTPSRSALPAKTSRPQPAASNAAPNTAKPRMPPVPARLAAKGPSVPAANPQTPLSPSQQAAQALEAMRLKARAVAAPLPSRTPDRIAQAPRRRANLKPKAEVAPESSVNARRRSGFETRAQLIERLNNPMLTLQETSLILRVCPATVRRYSNSGLLPHIRTEGNQRRFRWRDVQLLMREMEARRK